MSSGERLRIIRVFRGLTMKALGMLVGFTPNTADIRISQYETNVRTPRPNILNDLAKALDVSPDALDVPEIDTLIGLFHTLFALEDMYNLLPTKIDGTPCLITAPTQSSAKLAAFIQIWADQMEKLINGEITREEYDEWRYHYPEISPNTELSIYDNLKWKTQMGKHPYEGK